MNLLVQRREYNLLIHCGRFLMEAPRAEFHDRAELLMAREEAFELETPDDAANNVQTIKQ